MYLIGRKFANGNTVVPKQNKTFLLICNEEEKTESHSYTLPKISLWR